MTTTVDRHNIAVSEIAKWYASLGCQVEAALPGSDWPEPKKIYNRIPDVVLHKGNKKVDH